MKERSIKYEDNFRKYLFSGDFQRHEEICKNINVAPKVNAVIIEANSFGINDLNIEVEVDGKRYRGCITEVINDE
jgi:hypothetical protein